MNGNRDSRDDRRAEREERRRMRRERKDAMRGQTTLAHAVRGPITLITIGVLFALNNFTPYGFDKTWPVILIVFGLLTLVGRSAAPEYIPPVPAAPPVPPAKGPSFDFPPAGFPSPAPSYRQSTYTETPQEAAGPAAENSGRNAPQSSSPPAEDAAGAYPKEPEPPGVPDLLSPAVDPFGTADRQSQAPDGQTDVPQGGAK